MPKVSVIIPNYNHAAFLEQRINSVTGQTNIDIEVIILDDCSTDNSRDIIEQYRHHPRVSRIIYNEINSGSTFSQWNKGIELCKSEIIWIAESDDFADESFLSRLTPVMLGNENIGIAYCQSFRVNNKSEVTGTWKDHTDDLSYYKFSKDFMMSGKEYIKQFLINRNTIPNASGVIFRKNLYQLAGGADSDIKYCSDWLTWLKILVSSDISYVAEPLNYFRYHEHSVIANAIKNTDFSRYVERHARTMRNRFQKYLEISHQQDAEIGKMNLHYIFKEYGDEGLFEINNYRLFKGWNNILKTLGYDHKLYYVKAGLKQLFKQIIRM